MNVFKSSLAKFFNPSADDFTEIAILIRIVLCNVRLLYKSDFFITTLAYHLISQFLPFDLAV